MAEAEKDAEGRQLMADEKPKLERNSFNPQRAQRLLSVIEKTLAADDKAEQKMPARDRLGFVNAAHKLMKIMAERDRERLDAKKTKKVRSPFDLA
jgi:hypothetical protein